MSRMTASFNASNIFKVLMQTKNVPKLTSPLGIFPWLYRLTSERQPVAYWARKIAKRSIAGSRLLEGAVYLSVR